MLSKILKTHTRVDLWKAFRRKEEMCGMQLKSEKRHDHEISLRK